MFVRRASLPRYLVILIVTCQACSIVAGEQTVAQKPTVGDLFKWKELPSLPDPIGVAGAYAGVSHDVLLVAGGANFPTGPSFEGHPKKWHADTWALPGVDGSWRAVNPLSRPLAYGVSVSWRDKVICAGGCDSQRHSAEVFSLEWTGDSIAYGKLPDLPEPVAYGAGVLLGDTLYVAGGTNAAERAEALRALYSLDLLNPDAGWRIRPAWPGSGKYLPVMAAHDDLVYLFGGARLYRDSGGSVTREFLADCWRFDPASDSWAGIADSPTPIVAAPSPAMPVGANGIAMLSGDDGENFFRQNELKDEHPGFPETLWVYNTSTDAWAAQGRFPKAIPEDTGPLRNLGAWPPVTTTTVRWRDGYVIPSGEVRPGVRTPKVWFVEPAVPEASFGAINWLTVGVYLAGLVLIGVLCNRQAGTSEQFFLGGRRIPWWAAGISIFGTTLSAITFLALPARTFGSDWSAIVLNAGILIVAPFIAAVWIPRLHASRFTTAYEYLEARFSLGHRLFGAATFTIFQLARMGIVVLLPALALSAVTGIGLLTCIVMIGLLSTLYTTLGGIEAVIWTDVLQVFVLVGGAVIALVTIVTQIDGGSNSMIQLGREHGKFSIASFEFSLVQETFWVLLLGSIFSNALVPYTSDQTIAQRYLSAESPRLAARAVWTNALLAIPATLLFMALGTALFAFYRSYPERLHPLGTTDQILPWFIANEMPVGFAGLVVAGVFAAAMSSLDSALHSVSTVISHDFVRRLRPQSDRATVILARCLIVGLGVAATGVSIWMSMMDVQGLFDFAIQLMGLIAGPLAGLFLLGMTVPRARALEAWVGIVISLAAVITARFATPLHGLLYGAVGIIVCWTVGAGLALLRSDAGVFPLQPISGRAAQNLEKSDH